VGSITINSNIASLNAQRRFGASTAALQDSFTRLSSGLRINKASDDAAGLAIANSLEVDRRVFTQGVRNLNDGASLLSIADGALNELSNITIRLTELAEQAANGALSNTQRGALDEEAQALKAEYFRISKTTEFNGQKLFEGEFGQLRLQAGFGESGGIVSTLGGAIGDGSFENATSFAVGNSPRSVITGDLNGDGILDLIAADRSDDTLSVLLGDGTGSFSAATSFAVGNEPRSVSIGDLNGDGILDLISANRQDASVSVLLGDGTGSFSTATSFAVGSSPRSVSIGDLNGDGILDLITADYNDDTVSVVLGDGTGNFSAATSFTVGDQPRSVSIGDLNGDGLLDLVTADYNNDTVSVLLGDGTGNFSTATSFAVGNGPTSVKTGDFNGDGVLDLLTADYLNDTASVLLGDGTGNFSTATSLTVGNGPFSVDTGDFNGDGVLDILAANRADDTISVILGDGTGSFSAATSFAVGNGPRSVSAGDFNGDGVLDLLSADAADDTVSVLLGSSTDGVAPLLDFSLKTQADARQVLPVFKRKLDQIAGQRGQIGAFEARLSTAIATTRTAAENYASAASQIIDADIAVEAAKLVRNQILQQAGAAILAQANQAPALALRLLG